MPEVPGQPYEPYGAATPVERPLRTRGVANVPDAFGAGVARAIQTFGGDVEGAGNEIFNRALALRETQIHNDVRDATTDYYYKVAPLQEGFMANQGKNASPEALQAHLDQVNQVTQDYTRDMASKYGEYGQKLFGDEAAAMQRSIVREATLHSATETKRAHDDSITAQNQTIDDQIRLAPNYAAYQAAIALKRQNEQERGLIRGWDQPTTDFNANKEISKATRGWIEGLKTRDPVEAYSRAVQAMRDGTLREADIAPVMQEVQTALATNGARQVVSGMRDGSNGLLGQQQIDLDRARRTIGSPAVEGGKYDQLGPVIRRGDYAGQQALGRYQVMPGNLPSWLKEAGMPPMTPQQFLADHAAQDQLFNFKFGQYLQMKHPDGTPYNFNDAASMWFTGQPYSVTRGNPKFNDGHWTADQYVQASNAQLYKDSTAREISTVASQQGEQFKELAPEMPDIWHQRVTQEWLQDQARDRTEMLNLKGQFEDRLAQGNIRSLSDAINDPVMSSIIQRAKQIDPTWGNDIHLTRVIRQAVDQDNTFSQARDDNFNRLTGMANDLSHQRDFANMDLYSQDLTAQQRGVLRDQQKRILAGKVVDNTHLKAAMQDLGPLLEAHGIRRSATDQDATNQYLLFQGLLARKLEYMVANKMAIPKNADEWNTLATPLLRDIPGSWVPWRWSHPYFQPPSAIQSELQQGFKTRYGYDPSPEQIGDMFMRLINSPEGQARLKELGETEYAPRESIIQATR